MTDRKEKEPKCIEKSRKEEKPSSGSINISKLEDELDLLPIPDFPSLDSDQKLVTYLRPFQHLLYYFANSVC